jgi:ferredoxin-NADP reductase
MVVTVTVLLGVSILTNALFAEVFGAPSNVESVYITVGILALIITPTATLTDMGFLIWASVWAMAAKYMVAISKKHLFNPAAFAVALTAITINQSASWWVANAYLLPFVIIGGIVMVHKIHRSDMVFSYALTAILFTTGYNLLKGQNVVTGLVHILVYSPLVFFACVMLTEPMTTPPRRATRIMYGIIVGLLFAPFVHIGSVYFTPELALLTGNIFAYFVSSKKKLILTLKEKVPVTPDVYDFVFESNSKFNFRPGQYMEWTLGHGKQDSRGIRRYFTIASAPTESEIRVGVKFYDKSSSYKNAMLSLEPGDTIVASQLSGDFTMPRDKNKKLVFIAGGIGITPFRSMIKYLLDRSEQRSVVLLYANKTIQDIAYANIFEAAASEINMETIFTVSDKNPIPENVPVINQRIDEHLILKRVPDFYERMFYISGPNSMVINCKEMLLKIGVHHTNIKTDYFPGFA